MFLNFDFDLLIFPEENSCEFGSAKFYAYCGLGGMLSCGITHTLVVPLDLVKCRIQVDAAKYKSIVNGFKVTIAEEGAMALTKGWAPTLVGYSMQGVGKFGFYELFKIMYSGMLGEVSLAYFIYGCNGCVFFSHSPGAGLFSSNKIEMEKVFKPDFMHF